MNIISLDFEISLMAFIHLLNDHLRYGGFSHGEWESFIWETKTNISR